MNGMIGTAAFTKLTVTEKDEIKCVACFLCATACPADCITIQAAPARTVGKPRKAISAKSTRCLRNQYAPLHILWLLHRGLP